MILGKPVSPFAPQKYAWDGCRADYSARVRKLALPGTRLSRSERRRWIKITSMNQTCDDMNQRNIFIYKELHRLAFP